MKTCMLIVVLGSVLALGGCASSKSGSAYERGQARTEQTVRMGVVEHVIMIRPEPLSAVLLLAAVLAGMAARRARGWPGLLAHIAAVEVGWIRAAVFGRDTSRF